MRGPHWPRGRTDPHTAFPADPPGEGIFTRWSAEVVDGRRQARQLGDRDVFAGWEEYSVS